MFLNDIQREQWRGNKLAHLMFFYWGIQSETLFQSETSQRDEDKKFPKERDKKLNESPGGLTTN